MLDWLLRPQENDMRTLESVRSSAQADALNRQSAGICAGRLRGLEGEALYETLGRPRTLLAQGDWPALPAAQDARPRLWEGLLASLCGGGPAVLLYTQPQSPALTAFSRLYCGGEARGGGPSPRGAGLLEDLPPDLLLDSLMGEPGNGQEWELLPLLQALYSFFARRGWALRADEAAALLRAPAPLLPFCPPPADGRPDPLAVPYAQREALARRLTQLAQEEPTAGEGLCLYRLLREGRAVSWHCPPDRPLTRRLLSAQLLRLAREGVPFCLVLDQPRGGWWGPLLAGLGGARVFCRCDLPPGWPVEQGSAPEAFSALLTHFEAVALAAAGQGAALWAGYLGSYERVTLTESRTRGLHLDGRLLMPGIGWRSDHGQSAVWQAHSRMDEAALRRALDTDGRGLLAGRDGRFTLYQ